MEPKNKKIKRATVVESDMKDFRFGTVSLIEMLKVGVSFGKTQSLMLDITQKEEWFLM